MKVRKLYKELIGSVADVWHVLPLTSDAKSYSSETTPKYIKKNGIVTVCGAFSPVASGTGSSSEIVMATLPEGYRPINDTVVLCQGSSQNIWLFRIKTDGSVTFGRYRNNSGYSSYNTSVWLPFNATFACADKLGGY